MKLLDDFNFLEENDNIMEKCDYVAAYEPDTNITTTAHNNNSNSN
jgi:hypothetical protein